MLYAQGFLPFEYKNDILYLRQVQINMESNNNMDSQQLKYVQIEEDLKKLIFSDKIQPGDKLPSENTLAEKYQVSRQTVRKALNELIHEGYIYAEHGRGTFCSEMIRHMRNSRNIGVIMTYMSDYIFPHVLKGIDSILSAEDYSIIIKTTNNSRSGEAKCLEELLQKDIDGLIIEPSKSHIYCRHVNLYPTTLIVSLPISILEYIIVSLPST